MRRFVPSLAAVALLAALPLAGQIVGTTADFDWQPATPKAGQTIQFNDRSVGSIFGWYWSFGDGSTSGLQNPTHVYANPGVYSVTLAVLDRSLQQASTTKTVSVAAGGTTAADFSFAPTLPSVGQTVQFTDLTQGSPTSWSWDFGDGGTSTQKNPAHAYATAADFQVRLTATTSAGPSTVTKTVSVQPAGVSAGFAFFPQEPTVGDPVSFQNLSTGSPTSFAWNFGDGGTSTEEDPTHTFQTAGAFQVTLTASTGSASDTATQTVTVVPSAVGTWGVRVVGVEELPSDTTNGNGHPEPGERLGVRIALTNGTSRSEAAVVAQLLPWTWSVTPVVDLVDFGSVPSGAASATAEGRFEVLVNSAYPCDARLTLYVRLFLAGHEPDAIPVDMTLPNGSSCEGPALVPPSVVIDEPPAGTSYAIGDAVPLAFTTSGSAPTQAVRAEISRDGGATYELLTDNASELTGIGPHIYAFRAAGPASARVRFRVSVELGLGGSMTATSSRDIAFVQGTAPSATARLPVAVQAPGANQTFFTTEATIASPDGPAAVVLTFTPVGGAPLTLGDPVAVPRGSRYIPDVFQPFRDEGLLGQGQSLVGTLSARTAGGIAPVLTERVTNLPRSGIGSFGLSFGSRPDGQGVSDEAWVCGLITGSTFRSNLSIAHVRGGSGGDLGLVMEVYDGGTGQQVPGSPRQVVLPPDGFTQVNNFAGFVVRPNVPYLVRVRRVSGDDQFRAYGTIIDAVTGDPSYVEGSRPSGNGGFTKIHVPSVVEAAGLYGAFFTSDVVVANRSATGNVVVSFRLQAQGSWEVSEPIVLGPHQSRIVTNIVQFFRDHGARLTAPVVGLLHVDFGGGDGYVLVRTSSPASSRPGSGTFGLAYPGRRDAEEAQTNVLLPGARKSGAFRSNLSLVHVGDDRSITLSYRLVASLGGATVGSGEVTLVPGQFFQVSDVVGALGGSPGFYDVVVTRTAGSDPWEAYLTILDNVTNDGSFVEMIRR